MGVKVRVRVRVRVKVRLRVRVRVRVRVGVRVGVRGVTSKTIKWKCVDASLIWLDSITSTFISILLGIYKIIFD
jgi:hypothetical protein